MFPQPLPWQRPGAVPFLHGFDFAPECNQIMQIRFLSESKASGLRLRRFRVLVLVKEDSG